MANRVSEDSIVKASQRWLKSLPGCKVRKRRGGMSNRGEPDLYGCIHGIHFEIEVKAPGNTPTKHQVARLEEWEATDAITGVSYCLDDTKTIILTGLLNMASKIKPVIKQFLSGRSEECLKHVRPN